MYTLFEVYNWMFFESNKRKHPIDFSELSLKIGTSIIFYNSMNQVLLLLRDDIKQIPYPNCWDIPGGGLEEGETPQQTIVREMKEEIELELSEPKLFNVSIKYDRIEYTFWQVIDLDLSKTPLHEGQMLKWFSKEEIENLAERKIAFDFKHVLLEFFENNNKWNTDDKDRTD
jgi:8-oxo-dGTP diphosphatase